MNIPTECAEVPNLDPSSGPEQIQNPFDDVGLVRCDEKARGDYCFFGILLFLFVVCPYLFAWFMLYAAFRMVEIYNYFTQNS